MLPDCTGGEHHKRAPLPTSPPHFSLPQHLKPHLPHNHPVPCTTTTSATSCQSPSRPSVSASTRWLDHRCRRGFTAVNDAHRVALPLRKQNLLSPSHLLFPLGSSSQSRADKSQGFQKKKNKHIPVHSPSSSASLAMRHRSYRKHKDRAKG